MSIRPGVTILPLASIVSAASPAIFASTAAILPPAIATSRIASSPTEGSMTRPPLMSRSYVAASAPGAGANIAVAAVDVARNWRRFIMVDSSTFVLQEDAGHLCAATAFPIGYRSHSGHQGCRPVARTRKFAEGEGCDGSPYFHHRHRRRDGGRAGNG